LEEILLTILLNICKERGLLKERGKQRTDSTHIEAAIRTMNRVECVGETLRAALNSLAVVVPDWLRAHVSQDWYERYEKRMEEYNMPKEATKRAAVIQQIGQDGFNLLKWVREEEAPTWLKEIPAVEILRKVWIQQFYIEEEKICWRSNNNIPPSSLLISSPYDIQAHMSVKRDIHWTGYKAHLTETCDDDLPHLIVNVKTAPSTTQDMELTDAIHEELGEKYLLPQQHYVDSGYIDSVSLVNSSKHYDVDLIGPCRQSGSWQAKETEGYDSAQFLINWDENVATCPEGKKSMKWKNTQDDHGQAVIVVHFSRKDCNACPVRSLCTRAAANARKLTLRPQEQHEAIQSARQRQTTTEFKEQYAKRSGIEGTISQGVRAFDLRASRYLGMEKTHLQHVLIATAINVSRLFNWHMNDSPFQERISHFAALAA
jgi:transposase